MPARQSLPVAPVMQADSQGQGDATFTLSTSGKER